MTNFPSPREVPPEETIKGKSEQGDNLDEMLDGFAKGEIFPNEAVSRSCRELNAKISSLGSLPLCFVLIIKDNLATIAIVNTPSQRKYIFEERSGGGIKHKILALTAKTFSFNLDDNNISIEDLATGTTDVLVLREHHYTDGQNHSGKKFNSRAEHLNGAEIFVGTEEVLAQTPEVVKECLSQLIAIRFDKIDLLSQLILFKTAQE